MLIILKNIDTKFYMTYCKLCMIIDIVYNQWHIGPMNILIFVYPYLCMHVHVFTYLLTYHTNLLTIKSSQVKT